MGFNNESTIEVELDKSVVSFDAGHPGQMTLSVLGKQLLETQPISFGPIDETAAYHKIFRKHNFQFVNGFSVDTETIIPMGAEPKISRTMDIVGNHIKVVTDILTRGKFPAQKMSIDDIDFKGEWTRFGVITYPTEGSTLPEIVWTDITDSNKILYQSNVPFLVMLLESVDGHVVEIGTGDDLWRWSVADTLENTNSQFTVENNQGQVSLKRDVLIFDEERAMHTQTWRFKWYISWEMKAERNDKIKIPADSILLEIPGSKVAAADADLPAFSVPVTGWTKEASACMNGVVTEHQCAQTKTVRNYYNNWFRPIQKRYPETKIALANMEPHICDSGAHVSRKDKGTAMHWDMINIFDFWLWANKQAGKNDGRFVILPPEGSVAAQLPSMRGLSR